MEEDIKILERYLKNSAYKEKDSDFFKDGGWEIVGLEIPQAIENLINGYRELEENKKLKTIKGFEENIEVSKFGEWVGKNYIDYKFEYENYQRILVDYIPKSKIKEINDKITSEMKYLYVDTSVKDEGKYEAYMFIRNIIEELMEHK